MKTYTLYAGVNGAGKSTLYQMSNSESTEKRVNSDEILLENGGDWRNINNQINAMREATRRVEQYLKDGVSFNQETTLAGKSIVSVIKRAKEQGFYINLYYVGLENSDIAVKRVAQRVEYGGHGVDFDTIRKRYEASLKRIREVLCYCDNAFFFDNSGKALRRIAEKIDEVWVIQDKSCQWFRNTIGYMDVETFQSSSTVD